MYQIHTYGSNKYMHVVHSGGFRFGDGFGYTYLIGFETLKVKCTQYGSCSQAAFKNTRAMFFSKLSGADSNFR